MFCDALRVAGFLKDWILRDWILKDWILKPDGF